MPRTHLNLFADGGTKMPRLKSAIHYVIFSIEPDKLGAVKLAKILLYADMELFRRTGKTITGASYEKRDRGPLAKDFNRSIDELKMCGYVAERQGDYFGRPQRQFWATKEPDISEFTAQEIAILSWIKDAVCCNHSATSISSETHKNLAWQLANDGQEIPISAYLAAYRQGVPSPEEIESIKQELALAE